MDSQDSYWPISKTLLKAILDDRISDYFVTRLVWERLGYKPSHFIKKVWDAGPLTPSTWANVFPNGPEVIAQRKASVQLTRSIPKEYKQLLKQKLDFKGYQIDELYPRRTRRATVVNWLLAWLAQRGESLEEKGAIPTLLEPPINPANGHPGDLQME